MRKPEKTYDMITIPAWCAEIFEERMSPSGSAMRRIEEAERRTELLHYILASAGVITVFTGITIMGMTGISLAGVATMLIGVMVTFAAAIVA